MFSEKLSCTACKNKYSTDKPISLCSCGNPLLLDLNLSKLKKVLSREDLYRRSTNMWRYKEFLPVKDSINIISLGEGFTPITFLKQTQVYYGLNQLFLKNDGFNPTGTFKDRRASAGVSKAKELGVKIIALTSAGNAGGAWASYAAAAGIIAHIAMPEDTPEINVTECLAAGATVYLVRGLISDAGSFIEKGIKKYGWYNASTLKEPYRIEGKKTMGLELAEQFNWQLPDVIIYPCGGGVGLIGMWKAFSELAKLGWIVKHRPRLIAVQAEGCAPVVKAFENNKPITEYFNDAATSALGLRVPKPLGDHLILRAIYQSGGAAVAIPENNILKARMEVLRMEGLNVCLEGAAALASLPILIDMKLISRNDRVLVLNTGTGLKSPCFKFDNSLPVYNPEDEIL